MKKQIPKISKEETNRLVDNALKWLDKFREEMRLEEIERNKKIDALLFELDNLKPCICHSK